MTFGSFPKGIPYDVIDYMTNVLFIDRWHGEPGDNLRLLQPPGKVKLGEDDSGFSVSFINLIFILVAKSCNPEQKELEG